MLLLVLIFFFCVGIAFWELILAWRYPFLLSTPKTAEDAPVTNFMHLFVAWVWQGNFEISIGPSLLKNDFNSSIENFFVNGGSKIFSVSQFIYSVYCVALKFITGILKTRTVSDVWSFFRSSNIVRSANCFMLSLASASMANKRFSECDGAKTVGVKRGSFK